MFTRIYKIFAWLSLDVTAGAIVFMHFLSQEFGTPVHWLEATALGLAVWVIYSIDHLLDVRGLFEPISERRRFHQKHYRVLIFLTVIVLFSGIWIATRLPRDVVIVGGVFAIIAASYLAVAQFRKWACFKEVQIAIGYTGGVSLVPLVNLTVLEPWHGMAIGLLFLTALVNLILFSWYEHEQDQHEGFTSLVLALGEKKTSWILTMIFILTVFGTLALFQIGGSWRLVIFFLAAGLINFSLWKYSEFLLQNNRYRAVGDAVFLLPFISLI